MFITVVAIKDHKADCYSQPMFFATEGQAIRAFQDALNDPQSNMHKHPSDYDLYKLGTFDDLEGIFTNEPKPQRIAIGDQLKNA